MMTNRVAFTIVLLLPALIGGQRTSGLSPSLAITHVTVVDATGAAPRPDTTLLIAGDRITAIGKSGNVRIPPTAHVIDGTGQYVIPGLWDMHVHVFDYRSNPSGQPPREYQFPLLIANGITSMRLMWVRVGEVSQVERWRKQAIERPGSVPRIPAIGMIVDGPPPPSGAGAVAGTPFPAFDVVTTADEARRMVETIKAGGVDFVKVYSHLSRDAYSAIADEARKKRIPFAGHVPETVSAFEASDASQRTIEHLSEILYTCSSQEEEFRKLDPANWNQTYRKQMLDTYDEAKCARLFARFRANGTWQVPTLVETHRRSSDALGERVDGEERLKYIPATEREQWSKTHIQDRERPAETNDNVRREWRLDLMLVKAMRRARVEIMAGTDLGNAYVYPGVSLHDELTLLVKAGLTPMEALQAATLNPARFLGMEKDLGTVPRGRIADLVLLEANPLDDVGNTRRIAAVVMNGRFLPREWLDKTLADAEAAA
jgi:imidazolonepropionase-like amidohydrolase